MAGVIRNFFFLGGGGFAVNGMLGRKLMVAGTGTHFSLDKPTSGVIFLRKPPRLQRLLNCKWKTIVQLKSIYCYAVGIAQNAAELIIH